MRGNQFTKSKNPLRFKHWLLYVLFVFALTFLILGATFALNMFTEDYFFYIQNTTLFQYLVDNYYTPSSIGMFYSYWVTYGLNFVFVFPTIAFTLFFLFHLANLKFITQKYCAIHSRIVNSCNPNDFKDKVALVVGVCNDFLPNTLLQTANQTYKNIDVWICDDSNDPKTIQEIDDFVKKHKNVYVCRRPDEHKKLHRTKIGNVSYWLGKYGLQYDYVFENDSSSIVTSTFVENGLCYFHSELLRNVKINAINCNGSFYQLDKLITKINSASWQVSNEALKCIAYIDGNRILNDGWCALYKVSTLKQIPLDEVDCAACDAARGSWLSKRGYTSIVEPFDFSGKMGIQNMKAFEIQRAKWYGAESFMCKNNIVFMHKNHPVLWKLKVFTYYVVPIPLFTLWLANAIVCIIMKISYINFTSLILTAIIYVIVFMIPFILSCISHHNHYFKKVLFLITGILLEILLKYKRIWYFFICDIIFNKKAKRWALTKKTLTGKTLIKDRFKCCIPDICWILICLAVGITITVLYGFLYQSSNGLSFPNNFSTPYFAVVLWLGILPVLIFPSILYIIYTFIGEIKIKNGFNPDDPKPFPIEKYDFRYEFIKESEIWKKQHPNDKNNL